MAKKKRGGININDSRVDIGGDAIGRDKIEEHTYIGREVQDEKNGFVLFIERAFAFVITLLFAGAIFVGIGTLIGEALDAGEAGAIIGIILALGFAISAASNVSRFR